MFIHEPTSRGLSKTSTIQGRQGKLFEPYFLYGEESFAAA